MEQHDFVFTVSRAAVSAGMQRVPLPDGFTDAAFKVMLDQECVRAASDPSKFVEIIDARDGDSNHFVLKLEFPGKKLIALVADEPVRREFSGKLGKSVITVCTYGEAHKNLKTGPWKTVDGSELFTLTPPARTSREEDDAAYEADLVVRRGKGTRKASQARAQKQARLADATERRVFAIELLHADPELTALGKDGVHQQVLAKFGTGMDKVTIAKLRAEVKADLDYAKLRALENGQAEQAEQSDANIRQASMARNFGHPDDSTFVRKDHEGNTERYESLVDGASIQELAGPVAKIAQLLAAFDEANISYSHVKADFDIANNRLQVAEGTLRDARNAVRNLMTDLTS